MHEAVVVDSVHQMAVGKRLASLVVGEVKRAG
jgi:hypothetical protein